MSSKFIKNDLVVVISGSSKGKRGKILSVAGEKIIVEGVNLATIHKKATQSSPGKILKLERSIHASNLSHLENNKAVKVKFLAEPGDGKTYSRKIRISKKTGKKIGN
jgi:large subunit ribosomal protein L24